MTSGHPIYTTLTHVTQMRKVDDWETLDQPLDEILDLAA